MRKINKGTPIESFDNFKKRNPGANWDDLHANGKEVYLETRFTILVEEQNCYCGYTEKLIEVETDCHLDHYIKKSLDPTKTFDWNNLIASCNDNDHGANYKDSNYCKSLTEYAFFFNPVTDSVQNYFYYLTNGDIQAKEGISDSDRSKVNRTIEVFNLNDSALSRRRADLIESINDTKAGGLSNSDLKKAFSTRSFPSVLEQLTSE